MSQTALMLAVEDAVAKNLQYNGKGIEKGVHISVMPDPKPMPMSGDFFIAVHPGGFRGTPADVNLDVYHNVNLTITMKINYAGQDKIGTNIITRLPDGLEELCQQVINIVHNNEDIMLAANAIIKDNTNQFVEPLRFSHCPPPRIVGSDFTRTTGSREDAVIQTITFGEAHRIQYTNYQPLPNGVFNEKPVLFKSNGEVQKWEF